jgi:hypothetical protein
MEEEPRRIWDIINLLRLLDLPLWEDDNNRLDDDREDNNGKCNYAGHTTGNNKPRLAGTDDSGRCGGGGAAS